MEDDKQAIEVQDAKLQELKALIEEEQKKFDEQNEQLGEEMKKNRFEEAKSRDLNQKYAALAAKLEFIEKGYDYKGNVQGIQLEVLKEVMQKNSLVNEQLTNFVTKLDYTKIDTVKYIAKKVTYSSYE